MELYRCVDTNCSLLKSNMKTGERKSFSATNQMTCQKKYTEKQLDRNPMNRADWRHFSIKKFSRIRSCVSAATIIYSQKPKSTNKLLEATRRNTQARRYTINFYLRRKTFSGGELSAKKERTPKNRRRLTLSLRFLPGKWVSKQLQLQAMAFEKNGKKKRADNMPLIETILTCAGNENRERRSGMTVQRQINQASTGYPLSPDITLPIGIRSHALSPEKSSGKRSLDDRNFSIRSAVNK